MLNDKQSTAQIITDVLAGNKMNQDFMKMREFLTEIYRDLRHSEVKDKRWVCRKIESFLLEADGLL